MNKSDWKIIAASVAGTSHVARGVDCQDAFASKTFKTKNGEEILAIVVSDGAGSATRGGTGAKIVCQMVVEEIRSFVEQHKDLKNLTREHVLAWVKLLQTQFEILAHAEKLEIADFAATLLAAIVTAETAFFIQIGDGGIVYSVETTNNDFHLASEPQQGEYANATNFVTGRNAADVLSFEVIETRVGEIALFTDGLQRIALDYAVKNAHAPFFRPMFAPLKTEKMPENLAEKLHDFLDSPKINERTDDDKTLVLASRQT